MTNKIEQIIKSEGDYLETGFKEDEEFLKKHGWIVLENYYWKAPYLSHKNEEIITHTSQAKTYQYCKLLKEAKWHEFTETWYNINFPKTKSETIVLFQNPNSFEIMNFFSAVYCLDKNINKLDIPNHYFFQWLTILAKEQKTESKLLPDINLRTKKDGLNRLYWELDEFPNRRLYLRQSEDIYKPLDWESDE